MSTVVQWIRKAAVSIWDSARREIFNRDFRFVVLTTISVVPISCAGTKYSAEASALKAIAEERGFSAWIDVEHPFRTPPGSRESDQAQARHLLGAMESCCYILFFETTRQWR